MSYGKLYTIPFKNRIQNDIYRCEIWKKDYASTSTELEGAETPFTAEYKNSDNELFNPIQTVLLTLSFLNGTISVEDFYSEDDEQFRIDFYCQELSDETSIEKLLYTGYVLQDECSEELTDIGHAISLKATDNLGLLKDITFDIVANSSARKQTLRNIIEQCLFGTGLYSEASTIPMSLPIRYFVNLYENTMLDRSDSSTANPFDEIVVHSGMFQNDDGTWRDCYEILSFCLRALNAGIMQVEGFWNIFKLSEYSLFTDGAIPGTQYNYNGATTDITAVTLNPLLNIDRGGTIFPVNEDQIKSIQRPLKYVKNTFNYRQPAMLIKQQDLSLPAGATAYATSTVSGIRYDKYSLATYVPDWTQIHDDASYLEVVTDTNLDPDTEIDRYIVTPCCTATISSVRFNPIEVSKGDKFNFSFRWRTDSDTDITLRMFVRILLVLPSGDYRGLAQYDLSSNFYLHWTNSFASGDINNDSAGLIYKEPSTPADFDTTEWMDWSLTDFTDANRVIPVIPEDAMLYISVFGTNGNLASNTQGTYWKDLKLEFTNYINNSTQIIGQTHNDSQTAAIKNNIENDIYIDDSPRNTIAGTLFTLTTTTFPDDIGVIFFTKTTVWHRAEIAEALRLGNIITKERLLAQQVTRRMLEGSFMNLRYTDSYSAIRFVNMLNLFTIGFYPGKKFIINIATFDYMACAFNAKLIELFADSDALSDTYVFNYLYNTT